MEMRNIIVGMLIFALFGFALISFNVNFGLENNADILVTNDNSPISEIYFALNSTIPIAEKNATDSFDAFYNEEETSGMFGAIGDFFMRSLLSVGKSIAGIANTIFDKTLAPLLKAVGLPSAIANVVGTILTTMMLFTMILLAWKLYRSGS